MCVFDTLIRPIVEYCKRMEPLCVRTLTIEGIQKTFTRCAFKKCMAPRLGYHDSLLFLGRTSLECHRVIDLITTFYIICNKHVTCNVIPYSVPPVRGP